MKNIVAAFLLLFFAISISAQNSWRNGEMEVKVHLHSHEDLLLIKKLNLDFESASTDGTVMYVYVTPPELSYLRLAGLKCEILVSNLNEKSKHFWDNPLVESYHNYTQLGVLADSLAANFPSICKKVNLGNSAGMYPLFALKISDNVNVKEPEPTIMFDGGIHGDEIMGPEILIRFARDLCKGYGNNPAYTELINGREIWLFYLVNPDGFINGVRTNINDVDINRDGAYMWNGEGGSFSSCSQPETKALRNCQLDNNFVVYTNFHGGTEQISYPWSYREAPTPDNSHIDELASVYSTTSGYPNFYYAQGFTSMYAINGSTKDTQYGLFGQIGWSIEITNDKQPPSSQIQMYYSYNVPAMVEMISRSGYGIEGIVTDSLTGNPVLASIQVNNYYPVFSHPANGDYHKYILPGIYAIKVTANGFKTKTVTGIVVPATGSVVANMQLARDTGWFASKVLGCQIPRDNFYGFNDQAFTPGTLGTPDNIYYSLGKNGWIILDMKDTIFNKPGNDLKVSEGGTTLEGFSCYVSNNMDGPWTSLGAGTGTKEFDLGYASVNKARYIKIKDDGDGPTYGTDLGYDLDAIQNLAPPLLVDFNVQDTSPCMGVPLSFHDWSMGNPTSWSWTFQGGTPSVSTLQNPLVTYFSTGTFSVSLTASNGYQTYTKTKTAYIVPQPAPLVNLGADTTICVWQSLTLDAGNPGCSYLWSTGSTEPVITVDSTGIGIGQEPVWVKVTNPAMACTGTDTLTITFDGCTAVPTIPFRNKLSVNPNPSSGRFFITVDGFEGGLMKIYDLSGQEVASKFIPEPYCKTEFDFSLLHKGIYFIRLIRENSLMTGKIIIK